MAVRILIHI